MDVTGIVVSSIFEMKNRMDKLVGESSINCESAQHAVIES